MISGAQEELSAHASKQGLESATEAFLVSESIDPCLPVSPGSAVGQCVTYSRPFSTIFS